MRGQPTYDRYSENISRSWMSSICRADQGLKSDRTELMDPSIVKLIVGVLGYAAEMERKAILKRTAEGRAVAQAAGVKMGRKRTWDAGLAATVKELREQGSGYGTIATKLGITSSKVRRILAEVG
ncbi:hypothetical protein ACLM45_12880 [Synechococcus sp. A10-1-5-9]|uniref:hypothetical protein n=1 Tax=Synechococcus sp. A10-1-5-9 TaxID=3392295 RepID=UPI0039E9664F